VLLEITHVNGSLYSVMSLILQLVLASPHRTKWVWLLCPIPQKTSRSVYLRTVGLWFEIHWRHGYLQRLCAVICFLWSRPFDDRITEASNEMAWQKSHLDAWKRGTRLDTAEAAALPYRNPSKIVSLMNGSIKNISHCNPELLF